VQAEVRRVCALSAGEVPQDEARQEALSAGQVPAAAVRNALHDGDLPERQLHRGDPIVALRRRADLLQRQLHQHPDE